MEDYSELEGKEVVSVYTGKTGVVVGCDPDIGITIVYKEDKNEYLHCLIGPSAPNFTNYDGAKELHLITFDCLVKQIKRGVYDSKAFNQVIRDNSDCTKKGGSPSAATCAFNQ